MDAIAIDGPAASGKTAIGTEVARRLGYRFLDTGAMYRAIAWSVLRASIDPEDARAVAAFARTVRVELIAEAAAEGGTAVLVDGHDATPHLRAPDVEAAVSFVSRVPAVREALVSIQREVARDGRIVMAGRDIGSVVLPEARVRVYLDASREIRAARRAEQMRAAGQDPDMDALVADLARRDGLDSSRETSPLTAAPGAVIINTDNMTIEEVVSRIVALAQE
jgi:cytidylate kinase